MLGHERVAAPLVAGVSSMTPSQAQPQQGWAVLVAAGEAAGHLVARVVPARQVGLVRQVARERQAARAHQAAPARQVALARQVGLVRQVARVPQVARARQVALVRRAPQRVLAHCCPPKGRRMLQQATGARRWLPWTAGVRVPAWRAREQRAVTGRYSTVAGAVLQVAPAPALLPQVAPSALLPARLLRVKLVQVPPQVPPLARVQVLATGYCRLSVRLLTQAPRRQVWQVPVVAQPLAAPSAPRMTGAKPPEARQAAEPLQQ